MMEYGLMVREGSGFGGTFNYSGQDYPCSLGTTGFGARLVNGGFSPNAETMITIRKSALPESVEFESDQPLSVTDQNGQTRELKIAKEGIRDCIFAWELTCDDPNQNA